MNRRRSDRVFLTGFMGSGKSTVAPLLAGAMGAGFHDLDAEIERRTGKSVTGIFQQDGEAYFRRVEREALFGTAGLHAVVVALGGGTIANEENFAFVKSAGLLVWLRVDDETLFSRLKSKTDRPLLAPDAGPGSGAGHNDDTLRNTMRRLLAVREPFYKRADIVIDSGSDAPATIASRIADQVSALPENRSS